MNQKVILDDIFLSLVNRSVDLGCFSPKFHISPVLGLMNDPNGFIYYNDEYHLFYQWNPMACNHSFKCWGHLVSKDLIHWNHESIALLPDEPFDLNGCYSGTAIEYHKKLLLFYTGNVKKLSGERISSQCIALMNENRGFDKIGPVFNNINGYTGHIRDPKVWRVDDSFYMLLGAQRLDKNGAMLLFKSHDLIQWEYCAEILNKDILGLNSIGYMIECPDFFSIDNVDYLVFCPQGFSRGSREFQNENSTAYVSGTFDYVSSQFNIDGFYQLDYGFDFYAPQTCLSGDGRRLMIAWMGLPESEIGLHPTTQHGWVHQMSCFRELYCIDNRLYQRPIRELKSLRKETSYWSGIANEAPEILCIAMELEISLSGDLTIDISNTLRVICDDNGIELQRRLIDSEAFESRFWSGNIKKMLLLIDLSSVEIFINDGEAVMTNRFFPDADRYIQFYGNDEIEVLSWVL